MIELPEILSNRAEVIKRMDSINIDFQPDVLRRETSGKWQTKYEEIAFIDRGGFAEVRKIKDRQTGAIKAIKIMSKANCQMTDNSADEINILKKLVPILILILQDHPNLVRFYEFFQDEKNYHLITEYH